MKTAMTSLTLRRPDDWHLHLRDGPMLEGIAGPSMQHLGRAIIMPNLVPPVVTGADARAYKDRILTALERSGTKSTLSGVPDPVMTLYLTETTDPDDVARRCCRRPGAGCEAVPCRSHHQFGQRRP